MAKRYTVTSERASDTKGAPVQVIAENDDDALERAARRVHGRHAEWHPMGPAVGHVYPGRIVIKTPMSLEERVVTERALWSVRAGWPAAAPEVTP